MDNRTRLRDPNSLHLIVLLMDSCSTQHLRIRKEQQWMLRGPRSLHQFSCSLGLHSEYKHSTEKGNVALELLLVMLCE